MFEEPNIKIYQCVNGDIDLQFALVNIIFQAPVNLDIRLFKHQLLYNILQFDSVKTALSDYVHLSTIMHIFALHTCFTPTKSITSEIIYNSNTYYILPTTKYYL